MDEESHPWKFDLTPISVTLIGIVSATLLFSIYNCIATCRHSQRRQTLSIEQLENPSNLDNSVIQVIPACNYTKEVALLAKFEDGSCSVCLCEFNEGEEVRILPNCTHYFHVACINMWLYSHSNCPICRTDTIILPHPMPATPLESGQVPSMDMMGP